MKDIVKKQQPIIAGIGELLWDMLPDGRRLGGAPANFALHSQALGGRTKIISAVGQDQSGLDILKQLSRSQIDTEHIQISELSTSCVDVKICQNGCPEYVIKENVAWDYIRLTPQVKKLAQICDAVCFGSLAQRNPVSRQSIQNLLASTKADCLRIFDINLRQQYFSRDIIEDSLQAANVLKLNDDELAVLHDLLGLPRNTELALRTLLDRYQLNFIAFTQGSSGSIMMDRDTISHCPGMAVTVKDTVGAGDAFTAAMVMGKLYGLPLEKMNQLAGKVAAYVCSQAGATLGIGGDRTENVLWRLQQYKEIAGISPKLAVLMIGTNNSNGDDYTAQQIGEGNIAIVQMLRANYPSTKVLILAIFPRGEYPSAQREKNAQASLMASEMADGQMVFYKDIGSVFLNADGSISSSIMPGFVHLSTAGYQLWAEAIEADVVELMQ